jgi:hypothetical protein
MDESASRLVAAALRRRPKAIERIDVPGSAGNELPRRRLAQTMNARAIFLTPRRRSRFGPAAALAWSAASVIVVAAFVAPVAAQQHVHQHGVVQIDAALDGPLLTVALNAPLDNLLGFERPPRSAAEQRAAKDLIQRLKDDPALIRPDPAAGCERSELQLESAALGLGNAAPDADGHAELDATWSFRCKSPERLAFIDLGLIAAYPRIARAEVQIAAATTQSRQVLKRPAQRIAWPR